MVRNGTIYLPTLKTRKRLADLVKARRVELGLTQVTASTLSDLTLTTWNLIENGRRDAINYLTLAKVAKTLGFDMNELVDFIQGGEAPMGIQPPNPLDGDLKTIIIEALQRIDRLEEFVAALKKM